MLLVCVCVCAGEYIPGCCPEGVVNFCSERITSKCNPRLSDTPFRVQFIGNGTENSMTQLKLMIMPVAIGAQLGTPDCSKTDLAQVCIHTQSHTHPHTKRHILPCWVACCM